MQGELSTLRSEITSLGIDESRISEQMADLRDANEMLFSKSKSLESENSGMKQAIDLMRVELQDMSSNEQSLVSKVRDIDSQNRLLLDE